MHTGLYQHLVQIWLSYPFKYPFSVCSSSCPDLSSTPVQENQQCGVFNSTQGSWQTLSCESALPYICKKSTKYSRNAEPLGKYMSDLTAHASFPFINPAFLSVHPSVSNSSLSFPLTRLTFPRLSMHLVLSSLVWFKLRPQHVTASIT